MDRSREAFKEQLPILRPASGNRAQEGNCMVSALEDSWSEIDIFCGKGDILARLSKTCVILTGRDRQ